MVEKQRARGWIYYALLFLFLAALLGGIMRLSWIIEIPFFEYKYLLHAHSHLAMMGWGFTSVSVALILLFLQDRIQDNFYHRILALNIIAVVGMMISFLYQGYGPISIFFSTLHLLSAYGFAWRFLRDFRSQAGSLSHLFVRWSVYWMLISSLGLWCIAPVSIFLGKSHILYHISVQFFLHFQFNGWFTFAIIAILLEYYRRADSEIPGYLFLVLQLSLVLTFALSITWSTPVSWLFYTNSLGVILQAWAVIGILYYLRPVLYRDLRSGEISSWLLFAGLLCLLLKIIAQLMVAIPAIAEISYTIRNFVIGFIHLAMMGSISLTLIAILIRLEILPRGRRSQIGYHTLLVSFVLMEVLLFTQGIMLWMEMGFLPYYYILIWGVTICMPLAILLIFSDYRDHLKSLTIPLAPYLNMKAISKQ